MGRYRISIKPSALKELEAIARKKDRQRIVKRIEQLGHEPWPAGCQKLSGQSRYRVRQGQYRIVYKVDSGELVVYVVKVGHRKDV